MTDIQDQPDPRETWTADVRALRTLMRRRGVLPSLRLFATTLTEVADDGTVPWSRAAGMAGAWLWGFLERAPTDNELKTKP